MVILYSSVVTVPGTCKVVLILVNLLVDLSDAKKIKIWSLATYEIKQELKHGNMKLSAGLKN
jgi:hypothetical protein